jgi:Ca2+-binding RTX toxin-like protein
LVTLKADVDPEIHLTPAPPGALDDLPGDTLIDAQGDPDVWDTIGVQGLLPVNDLGGHDTIRMNAGNDTGFGGRGEDTVSGGSGVDVVAGGDGNDELYGAEVVALIDLIDFGEEDLSAPEAPAGGTGGQGDWVDGGRGDDRVVGSARDDVLLGGAEADRLVAGAGDDTLFGDRTADPFRANGWRIARTLEIGSDPSVATARANFAIAGLLLEDGAAKGGEHGDDWLAGGAGDDWLYGEGGNDLLDGGADDDWLVAGEGDDTAIGGAGSDYLFGDGPESFEFGAVASVDHGADTLHGNDGNDRLHGNGGADLLFGDAGDDLIFGDSGTLDQAYDGMDVAYGGDGADTIHGGGHADEIVGGAGNDTLLGDGFAEIVAGRFHGADDLDGGEGDDVIAGTGGDDHLSGGSGDDYLEGDSFVGIDTLAAEFHGNDRLEGDDGDDTLLGGGRDDVLVGGFGADVLRGDSGQAALTGDDRLYGGLGDDELYGDAGNDVLVGGDGVDYLSGGTGDDRFIFERGDARWVAGEAAESVTDAGGSDTLVFANGILVDDIVLTRNPGGSTLLVRWSDTELLAVENGIDGAIEWFEFGDNERIAFREMMKRRFAESRNESVSSRSATLIGGALDDVLVSDVGGATFDGGLGDDTLTGRRGGNTYHYAVGDGRDTIVGAGDQRGPGGVLVPNRVVFAAGITPDMLTLRVGSFAVQVGSDFDDVIRTDEFDPRRTASRRAIDVFEFADGTQLTYDALLARGFDIDGTDAADTLTGTDTVDRLYGMDGDDFLNSFEGDDLLAGGRGTDRLWGGAGNDTYLFGYDYGRDSVEDAGGDADTIELLLGVQLDDLVVSRDERDLFLALNDPDAEAGTAPLDTLRIVDHFAGKAIERFMLYDGAVFTAAQIARRIVGAVSEGQDRWYGSTGDDDVDLLAGSDRGYGFEGDDRVRGGAGVDLLYGGEGADVLHGDGDSDTLDGGDGADTLIGGEGGDTLLAGAGDDVLEGGPGNDSVTGGAGNDTIVVTAGAGGLGDTVSADGKAIGDIDTLAIRGASPDAVRLLREWAPMGERDELIVETVARSAGGRDPVERFATISRAFSAQGGTAAAIDRIVFDDGTVWTLDAMRAQLPGPTDRDDRVGGFTTDDVVDGGRGRDQLGGGAGRDHLLGGRGDDALYGEAGEDTLEGGDGRDTLYGDDDSGPNVTAGADRLFGGADDDALHGGDGDDLLDGGAGRDTLRGGAGSDTYLWSRGDGADTIVDLGGTNDVLRFGPGIRPADVRVARFADFSAGGSVVLVVDDSGAQLRLVGHLSPFGGQIERIEFADGVDGAIGTAWRPAEVAARVGPAARIDALEGTSGDDRFVVDHMRDTVFDLAGEDRGVDTVRASVSFTLPEAIEQLELVGRLNLVGTGNRGDNRIAGTDFDDTLDGMQGHDVLVGGRGDDLYIDNDIGSSPANAGAYVRDEIVEQAGEGVDTIRSNAYHYALPDHVERLEADATLDVSYYDGALRAWVNAPRRWVGNALDNVIDASRAADTNEMRLDGGTGADRLIGHRGNDTFVVDDAGDVVVDDEGGFDTIESSIDWTLSTGVEQLVLTGASAITGRGTDGHDMLDGTRNTTANALVGGRGDDTYRVGAGDTVVEEADAGRDTVVISALSGFSRVVSLADWAHIENLQVADTAGTAQLLGDDGDNVLTGNRSNNTLVGGRGRDALRGGEGADQYVVAQMLGVRRLEAAAIATDTVFDDAPGDSFAIDTLRVGARSLDRVLVSREGGSLVLRFVRPHPDDPSLDVVFEHVEVGGQFGAISGTRIENLQFADGVVVPIASLLDAVTTGTWTSASTRGNAAPVVRAFEAPWRLSPDGTSVLDVRSGWITDADALDTVQVAATLVDGARLPAWLRWEWDPVTRSGRVSADAAAAPVGSHEVWFTASDAFGAGSAAPLTIEVPDRPRELVGGPGITELIGGDADDVLVGAGDVVRLVGGAGDDVYRVSHAGQKVVEAAGGGVDTVWVWNSFAVGVDAHVEVIRGERVDGGGMRAAGSVRDEFFVGTRGRDRVTGHGGFDVMLTGAGDDQVMMASSSGVVLAGAGRDLIALSSARPAFVAPGPGVDRMLTLSAPLIVGFNRGDGVDTYDWGGRIGVLSVGGGIRAEDLHVRALSTWTQLDFGGGDELRLRSVLGPADAADADAAADAGRTVRWLQVVPDAAPGDGADPHADAPAVEVYDFAKLLAAFDLARRADATLERWNAATALAGARVTDWADGTAFGGDLAWQYGRTGSLAAMGLGESRATVADPGFGLTGQPISRGTPDASGLRLV